MKNRIQRQRKTVYQNIYQQITDTMKNKNITEAQSKKALRTAETAQRTAERLQAGSEGSGLSQQTVFELYA